MAKGEASHVYSISLCKKTTITPVAGLGLGLVTVVCMVVLGNTVIRHTHCRWRIAGGRQLQVCHHSMIHDAIIQILFLILALSP